MNFKQKLDQVTFKAILEPSLRIFLSVDVVGSTAFKNVKRQQWLQFLHGFYTGFPAQLTEQLGKRANEINYLTTGLQPITLWKALGDELIFSAPLKHRADVCLYVAAFRNTIQKVARAYTSGENPLPISLKGTAWLAGFPVANSIVPLEEQPDPSRPTNFDFVGPLIDIGFRLSRFADPRHLVVSIDLAWLISSQTAPSDVTFHYQGREILKGALGAKPYPVFWINCVSESEGVENVFGRIENAVVTRMEIPHATVKDLSDSFLDSVSDFIPKPFFYNETGGPFQKPPNFDGRLEEMERELRRIYQIEEPEVTLPEPSTQVKSPDVLEEWQPESDEPPLPSA